MIEDMTIRKFAPKTQHDYLQTVKNFATYLGRSPDTASSEDVRRYQVRLVAVLVLLKVKPAAGPMPETWVCPAETACKTVSTCGRRY